MALLRAVNVGGTGALPMTTLKQSCEAAGFRGVRTVLASGNAVFDAPMDARAVKAALEARLLGRLGTPFDVLIRTADEMAEIVARNPFADAPGDRVVAILVEDEVRPSALEGVAGQAGEEIRLGRREIYVHYPRGIGRSRLRIRAAAQGTARNMNTVARLAALAGLEPREAGGR